MRSITCLKSNKIVIGNVMDVHCVRGLQEERLMWRHFMKHHSFDARLSRSKKLHYPERGVELKTDRQIDRQTDRRRINWESIQPPVTKEENTRDIRFQCHVERNRITHFIYDENRL